MIDARYDVRDLDAFSNPTYKHDIAFPFTDPCLFRGTDKMQLLFFWLTIAAGIGAFFAQTVSRADEPSSRLNGTWEFVAAIDSDGVTTYDKSTAMQLVILDDTWAVFVKGALVTGTVENVEYDTRSEPISFVRRAGPAPHAIGRGILKVFDDHLMYTITPLDATHFGPTSGYVGDYSPNQRFSGADARDRSNGPDAGYGLHYETPKSFSPEGTSNTQYILKRISDSTSELSHRASTVSKSLPAVVDGAVPAKQINEALREIHELLAERTRVKLKLTYLRKNAESVNADRSETERLKQRLTAIKNRLEQIHETDLASFERVAQDAGLANSEEPMFGQPAYGVILFATSTKDIDANELLLFHGDWVYRTEGKFVALQSPGEGWYFRPNVDIPAGTRFVVACHQDAPEEVENVKQGYMPNSDRARDPNRPYRTEIFGRDGKPLAQPIET